MRTVAIRMPKMSMTMAEGEVLSWSVGPGDTVEAGDVVCEVMTDKVDMEVESPTSGTLTSIIVDTGIVAVGEPIAWMETEDEEGLADLLDEPDGPPEAGGVDGSDLPDASVLVGVGLGDAGSPETQPEPETETQPEPEAQPEPAVPASPTPAVPRARALAREHGVDLATLTATRADGVVNVDDVEHALRLTDQMAPGVASPEPSAPDRAVTGNRVAAVRAVVARRMALSAAIPQFTVWRDLRLDGAQSRRAGVSWTTVILQAYSAALRRVPALLSRWEDDGAVESGPPAIGLAVDTGGGLLVPVFAEPDRQDPRELDAAVRVAVAKAQGGKVAREHLLVANATLSNLGSLGVDRFQALVTPGQASVLALGKADVRPVPIPGGLGLALTLTAGLTVDHRAADGADGARLLAALADILA